MTALTTNRDTPEKQVTRDFYTQSAGSAAVLWKGSMAMLNPAGYAVPGASGTGFALGRVANKVDNSGGGNGGQPVTIESGIFRWDIGDAFVQADVGAGAIAYMGDDHTMYKSGTGRSPAGIVVDLDSSGVWVETRPAIVAAILAQQAATLATAAAAVPLASVQQAVGTLVAGDVAIATLNITASSVIVPLRDVPDATAAHWGDLTVVTVVPGTPGSFHIHSSNAADTSHVRALVIG